MRCFIRSWLFIKWVGASIAVAILTPHGLAHSSECRQRRSDENNEGRSEQERSDCDCGLAGVHLCTFVTFWPEWPRLSELG